MHRRTWEEMTDCADCGRQLDVARERGFVSEEDWALCWECAVGRGAQFDENQDSWTTLPDMAGLPVERDHRIR